MKQQKTARHERCVMSITSVRTTDQNGNGNGASTFCTARDVHHRKRGEMHPQGAAATVKTDQPTASSRETFQRSLIFGESRTETGARGGVDAEMLRGHSQQTK